MKGIIKGFNWLEDIEPQKYWAFPASWDKKKRENELNKMIYSDNYLATEKKDGYWEMFIKDENGNQFLRSRSKGVNGVVNKYDWVPHLHDFFDSLPSSTILLGEFYLMTGTSKDITKILGCNLDKAIKRQENEKLRYYIFDVLFYDGEEVYKLGIEDRLNKLSTILCDVVHAHIDYAIPFTTPESIHENWLDILGNGGEGVVLVEKDYPYSFNKRTARKTLKLKKELEETVDVFLTGSYKNPTVLYTGKEIYTWPYWMNQVTGEKVEGTVYDRAQNEMLTPITKLAFYNWAASVQIAVMKDGKAHPIGWISGISDLVREGIVKNPEDYRGKVVEVQAMEIDKSDKENPTLRHGKIINWRDDKKYTDCSWEQLM